MINKKFSCRRGVGAGAVAIGASAVKTLRDRRSVAEPPYTVLGSVEDVELRQYRETMRVETTADDERTAFGRLFDYIDGSNEGETEIPMTAPVEVDADVNDESGSGDESAGTKIPMTAPVEVGDEESGVRMAFYLPEEYDSERAPQPTDDDVRLVAESPRTLAVVTFSGRATDTRKATASERLLDTLARNDVVVTGEPFFMGYDAPYSLPPLRRNEMAVELP
ncbi:MAG: heme-binding protein [Halobacteriales archaeon]|nr:heme-binding protein [Halobacteriales archaeon]